MPGVILVAMLSGMVNIAVFAAFHMCVGLRSLSNAAFKPVCGPRQLDISRYGWQKRQETARCGNGWHGRWQKWHGLVGPRALSRARYAAKCGVARGCGGRVCRGYAVVQGAGGAGWRRSNRTKIP